MFFRKKKPPAPIIPETLDEAVQLLIDELTKVDKDFIIYSDSASCHHGKGRQIRNDWGLWDKESKLARHFRTRWQLGHADDMSGLILTCLWGKVRGQDVDRRAEIKRYHEHWRRFNTNPVTMEPETL